ncbi:peptidoglycan-binding domain-containing protein [Vibrio sp. VB16]|uniref:peptidoglycan-binding domain-containing protein n=1 Tax=Vibrio sp. VB16 TaxID=2785746 RepID=UPI001E59DA9E|nr:peptidoglycan-binding domain-containing protein [Vibrio sp. VB16]UGA57242.1 peptidoglycan-binding protein [Vibrio sp. VB16]
MIKKSRYNRLHFPLLVTSILVTSGCTSTSQKNATAQAKNSSVELSAIMDKQQEKEIQLKEKEIELTRLEEKLKRQSVSQNNVSNSDNQHLPPNAQPGECYARVWNEPQYETSKEKVLVRANTEKLISTQARYATKQEKILVSEPSFKMIPTPAVYTIRKEKVLLSKADRSWKTRLSPSAPKASADTLKRARANGVDFDSAQPNVCYHEHLLPAKYETVKEPVLIGEETEKSVIIPASYRTVEKKILVKEASTKIVNVPAVYETISEQIVDKPAHQIWKKGQGAIQKIDESTGEIMCLVDVPTTYITVSKKVIKTPETTKKIKIPAVYKTIAVKEVVNPAQETRVKVAAKYNYVSKKKQIGGSQYVWHEIHDQSLSERTRTGSKICLIDTPATYKTIDKQVETIAASITKVEVPAKYKTVKVSKLVQPASVERKIIPAEYKMVERQTLIKEGTMEWRSILCDTNMTVSRIGEIQRTLVSKGYNPGKIDGVVGPETMAAVNAFQRDNDLPVDKYLNIATVKALNISIK